MGTERPPTRACREVCDRAIARFVRARCTSVCSGSQKCSTGALGPTEGCEGRRRNGRLGRIPSSSRVCSSAPAASVTRAVSYEGGTMLEEVVAGHGSGSCERWPCACAWRRKTRAACEMCAGCESWGGQGGGQGVAKVWPRCGQGVARVGQVAALPALCLNAAQCGAQAGVGRRAALEPTRHLRSKRVR